MTKLIGTISLLVLVGLVGCSRPAEAEKSQPKPDKTESLSVAKNQSDPKLKATEKKLDKAIPTKPKPAVKVIVEQGLSINEARWFEIRLKEVILAAGWRYETGGYQVKTTLSEEPTGGTFDLLSAKLQNGKLVQITTAVQEIRATVLIEIHDKNGALKKHHRKSFLNRDTGAFSGDLAYRTMWDKARDWSETTLKSIELE